MRSQMLSPVSGRRMVVAMAAIALVSSRGLEALTTDDEGKRAYDGTCAACHGAAGAGGAAPALVPLSVGPTALLAIVRDGGDLMAGFARTDITDAQVAAVERYLRGLSNPGNPSQAPSNAQTATPIGRPIVEWPYVGADQSNSRHSPLRDLTVNNVDQLQIAWRWRPEEQPRPEFGTVPGNFTSTPLMIDNVVYVSTNYNRLAALDAETGAVKWVFDPKAYEEGMPALGGGFRHRGVAFWRDGDRLRIILASRYRLYSLDAGTGQPVPSFGRQGVIDLTENLIWPVNRAHFEFNAAPVVYRDLIIVGSAVGDRLIYKNLPPGDVRAYHARTGKLVWSWTPVPREGDFATETWENNSWRYTGAMNVWAGVTVDEARGLVYVPTGNPTNVYYGGSRLGNNLFAETLVCLDANTGERKWHFQIVHHGVWDYDLPTQPILTTVEAGGRRIDAVVQLTKQGLVFVFDRVTGEPVWPIEERPVPQSDVPGERMSPTQPFPTRPPAVIPSLGVSLDDAFDLTPELQAAARAAMQKLRIGPLYTPPSLQGTLTRPSGGGAVNWGGGAFDPETGILYAKSSNSAGVNRLQKFDPATSKNQFADPSDPAFVGYDTAPGGGATFNDGIPLTKPPYAFLTAIDLNKGELAWRVPFGKGSDTLRNHPALRGLTLPDRLGTPGAPGSIVTAGGLVFVGGGDEALYAFDKRTGKEVWHAPLPRRTTATPMTYRAASGRPFVVVATGSGSDQELVAFAGPPAAAR